MKNMFDLSGRAAVVVGGMGDLGKSMVTALVEAGAKVAVIDLPQKLVEISDMPAKIAKHLYPVEGNIADRERVESSFAEALDKIGGRVDILLNAAGIQRRHPCEEFPLSDWDLVLEINLTAVFRYCQLAALNMIAHGSGKIINIASMLSFFGGYTVPAYSASKGGVAQLTKAFANEWAGKGLNINAIAPGYMDTNLNVNLVNDPNRSTEILARIPQHRWGLGEDLKGAVVFLASSASDYINGAIIPVDGGYMGR